MPRGHYGYECLRSPLLRTTQVRSTTRFQDFSVLCASVPLWRSGSWIGLWLIYNPPLTDFPDSHSEILISLPSSPLGKFHPRRRYLHSPPACSRLPKKILLQTPSFARVKKYLFRLTPPFYSKPPSPPFYPFPLLHSKHLYQNVFSRIMKPCVYLQNTILWLSPTRSI